MDLISWLLTIGTALACVGFVLWVVLWRTSPRLSLEQASRLFLQERMRLQRLFFKFASESGKPRGLLWKDGQWNELLAWARDKRTGQFLALAGVTISFEAKPGSDMEGIEAVGNLRNASAVFFFHDGQWQTVGRAVFNLNPDEVLERFKENYERIEPAIS